MCTVTWWYDEEGRYEVFANRDEQKTRAPADPPSLESLEGTHYLSPRDPEGGGTWILANEFGVVITLLNAYEIDIPPAPASGWKSRGQLVRGLASARTPKEFEERLTALDHLEYPPYRVLGFFPSPSGLCIEGWLGGPEMKRFHPKMPVSSSSFETETVLSNRAETFELLDERTPEALARFHASAGAEISARSVRMNRPDAQTWSISRVRVGAEFIRFHYEAKSLNFADLSAHSEIILPRRP